MARPEEDLIFFLDMLREDETQTKENTTVLRQAEENLDAFWSRIDQHLHRKVGNLKGTAVDRLLSSPRVLDCTPEWVEPVKWTTKNPEASPYVLDKPFSQSSFDMSGGSGQKAPALTPKPKVKTRGTANTSSGSPKASSNSLEASSDSPSASSDSLNAFSSSPSAYSDSPNTSSNSPSASAFPEENPDDLKPRFDIDARALKVFRMLFFHPDVTSTPGEVSWTEFLHAMVSIGFEAEKLYGSGWKFTPTNPGVGRWILFHEPHSHKKLPFTVARLYVKRLRRAYKWTSKTFTLKAKSG